MTQSKREPFARATKHPTLDTWIVADVAGNNLCWSDGSQSWEKWDAEARANAVNAAFNARVDEEVRKAVAPLRKELRRLKNVVSEEDYLSIVQVLNDSAGSSVLRISTEPEK